MSWLYSQSFQYDVSMTDCIKELLPDTHTQKPLSGSRPFNCRLRIGIALIFCLVTVFDILDIMNCDSSPWGRDTIKSYHNNNQNSCHTSRSFLSGSQTVASTRHIHEYLANAEPGACTDKQTMASETHY